MIPSAETEERILMNPFVHHPRRLKKVFRGELIQNTIGILKILCEAWTSTACLKGKQSGAGADPASRTFWGARGGVENGDFCMLFWDLPPQDASGAVVCDLPATGGRSLVPTTPVFPGEGAFYEDPLGGSKPKNPVPGPF